MLDSVTLAKPGVSLVRVDPGKPEIRALIADLDAYQCGLYPAESAHLLGVSSLQSPHVVFLAAYQGKIPVGCGAYVDQGDFAEIKRMYVPPRHRGRGVAGSLLAALEAIAVNSGLTLARLETGVKQPAAIALYEHAGYKRRPPFPPYVDDPLSIFMEKALREEAS